MHYTSPKNIHRLIDPLFLDGLKAELSAILQKPEAGGARTKALNEFHDKLASLSFLDPACGSGNFLTETYLELRRLENRILQEQQKDQYAHFAFEEIEESPVRVSLANFHGIEINDFACCVARTALWIAEKQADADTAKIVQRVYDELPLRDYGCIVQANALRIDWNDVVPAERCSYVMGNPPFVGQYLMSDEQKSDMRHVFGEHYDGYLDYATAWHWKAAEFLDARRSTLDARRSTLDARRSQRSHSFQRTAYAKGSRCQCCSNPSSQKAGVSHLPIARLRGMRNPMTSRTFM